MNLGLARDEIALQARARAFAHDVVRPRAAAIDRDEQYPWDIVKALAEAGFFGMTIPKALGGQDRSFLDAVLVIEEMAKSCTVTARIVVETNMGAISTVMAYGSEAQKKLAARLVLAGDKPAICITEPDAGSDALAMTTRADKRGDVLRHQRQEALDHRRRRLEAASDLRARVRRARAGTRHRRLPRRAPRKRKSGQRPARDQTRTDHGPARHAGRRTDVREPRSAGRHGGAAAVRTGARLCRPDERL